MKTSITVAKFARLGALIAPIASVALLSGCAADMAHRNAGEENTANASFQHVRYQTKEGGSGSFHIGYVEFDDQGWFQDKEQRRVLLEHLRALAAQGNKLLIVVYTHGWKHNADETDPDVRKFKTLLADLDLVEKKAKQGTHDRPREIVGVYLGWRGASWPVPLVEDLTFWGRKNAAERVGRRSAKQIMVELNEFRATSNCWKTADRLAGPNDTQLVFIGHSFGGLITFAALNASLTERALKPDGHGNYTSVAKSFGDFILLVNPAFEGAAYEPLWRTALTRQGFPEQQRPILAIVTSKADWATGIAFPAGRVYTLGESAPHPGEREAVLMTVGHLARYRTHVLTANADYDANSTASEHVPSSDRAATVLMESRRRKDFFQSRKPTDHFAFDGGTLTPFQNSDVAERFPYLVISASKEMIRDHNDIWNERFRGFMLHFVATHIMHDRAMSTESSCSQYDTAHQTAAE